MLLKQDSAHRYRDCEARSPEVDRGETRPPTINADTPTRGDRVQVAEGARRGGAERSTWTRPSTAVCFTSVGGCRNGEDPVWTLLVVGGARSIASTIVTSSALFFCRCGAVAGVAPDVSTSQYVRGRAPTFTGVNGGNIEPTQTTDTTMVHSESRRGLGRARKGVTCQSKADAKHRSSDRARRLAAPPPGVSGTASVTDSAGPSGVGNVATITATIVDARSDPQWDHI
jgi:hypothetical protein